MNIETFWNLIEESWKDSPQINKRREKALETNSEDALERLSEDLSGKILQNYEKRLLALEKEDFKKFIHILEERLFHIDREAIHEFTDGSDDGFLYCRCFILAMGERYYNMIDEEPSKATFDIEAEEFGFQAYMVYEDKFNEEFERYEFHSIETCSNSEAW